MQVRQKVRDTEGWGHGRFGNRRTRLLAKIVGSVIIGVGSLGYSYFIEPFWWDVTHTTVYLKRLPPQFAGLRLAILSDMHYGWRIEAAQMQQVVQLTNAQQPDVVCLTGDFIAKRGGYRYPPHLADLQAKLGKFAVLGNHDYYGNHADRVAARLRRDGCTVLRNQHATLEQAGARLHFAGVEDMRQRTYDLPAALAGIPATDCTILLAHNPDFVDRVPAGEVDLMLSGHTHGGQVNLPFIGPPDLPHKHEEWLAGLYQTDRLQLYINRGIGLSGIPHRLRARPEISILTLYPQPISSLQGEE